MKELFDVYYKNRDDARSVQMASYMRNQFPFLGIGSIKRAELNRPFFRQIKLSDNVNWEFVFECFDKPEREFTYLAISYIDKLKNNIQITEFSNFEKLASLHPWWDSIDSIAPIIGFICRKYNSLVQDYILKWAESGNKWLIRISIIYQLKYKSNTDLEILSKVILENNKTNEFFINKAIGWALRQYARTDRTWVLAFIENSNVSSLSKREALKRVKNYEYYGK